MEPSVLELKLALTGKSSTITMSVFVLKTLTGMEIGASKQVVLEDKNGMESNVPVLEASTLTEQFA